MNKWLKTLNVTLLSGCLLASFSLPVSAQNDNSIKIADQFTLNPGERGTQLPLGATIHHLSNGSTQVFNAKNVLLFTTSDANSDWVATPNGFMRANHIYSVPNRTIIDNRENMLTFETDGREILKVIIDKSNTRLETVPPTTGGYVSDANQTGKNLDTFVAYWTCPTSPPGNSPNITNFLFNAIEPTPVTSIIQPVLQWNQGGFPGWTGASWYYRPGFPGDTGHSPETAVSPGQLIYGYLHNVGGTLWDIGFYTLNGTQNSTTLSSKNTNISTTNNMLLIALESYNTQNGDIFDNDMPGDTQFTNIGALLNGSGVSITWGPGYGVNSSFKMTGINVTWTGSSVVNLLTAN